MTKQLKKTFIAVLTAFAITGITTVTGYYFSLPAINIHSTFFWRFLIIQVGIFSVSNYIIRRVSGISCKLWKSFAVLIILILLYWTFRISSSPMFHAKEYASVLPVNEETDFQQDIVIDTNKIALMDTSSAAKLGDREIGSLANVVSQYNVSGSYTQINYQGDPVKVAPLEYAVTVSRSWNGKCTRRSTDRIYAVLPVEEAAGADTGTCFVRHGLFYWIPSGIRDDRILRCHCAVDRNHGV